MRALAEMAVAVAVVGRGVGGLLVQPSHESSPAPPDIRALERAFTQVNESPAYDVKRSQAP